ncbi:MAG: SDR family oxidoreductase [Alphaproteobacteria bacterium]|nr:SDR family oxidoreductase [Alphaproteobacteria bacterium]
MKILVSGATGFVGKPLVDALWLQGHTVVASGQEDLPGFPEDVYYFRASDIDGATNWSEALSDMDAVVHLAARTHITNERPDKALSLYRKINVEGTRRLAEQAVEAGVKRFIFVSSIKVNGEGRDKPYTESDPPAPEDAYGQSKYEAEQMLGKMAETYGLEVVILRPPLLYGPCVKGNLASLKCAIEMGLPLPLGGISNKRSMLYVGSLIDVILLCLDRELLGKNLFLVGDGQDLSTPDLVRHMAKAMGKKARLFPFPQSVLKLLARLAGREGMADRLLGNLTIDPSHIRKCLGWTPQTSIEEGMKKSFVTEDQAATS